MKIRYGVVDDAPFIRELIKSVMSSLGHVCAGEANDGAEAVDLVARTLPDVLFLDLVMPKKNGFQSAKEILEIWPSLKIIACTTLETEEIPPTVDRRLFHGWLQKPFDKKQIETVLASLQKQDEAKT
jgi:two-component system chemotaxis response regulator CheY